MSTEVFGVGRMATIQTVQQAPLLPQALQTGDSTKGTSKDQLRKTFDTFLGEVYFGQMLKAMRKTVGKPAYVYGGQAEEIFTQQLDQVLAESLTKTLAPEFSGPMFELFTLSR
ncbi:MAG TPA: rod-binding protein, partial [Thermoguttaceae bacterium]|nr:rod-binding protein [Thermoguttaceae bacterium]